MIEKYFENIEILHIGTMPNRSYYIPFSSKMEALESENREDSAYFRNLNGIWKFKYFNSFYDFDESFIGINYNYDDITVPSVWQTQGYDRHQYINSRYPFPFDPP